MSEKSAFPQKPPKRKASEASGRGSEDYQSRPRKQQNLKNPADMDTPGLGSYRVAERPSLPSEPTDGRDEQYDGFDDIELDDGPEDDRDGVVMSGLYSLRDTLRHDNNMASHILLGDAFNTVWDQLGDPAAEHPARTVVKAEEMMEYAHDEVVAMSGGGVGGEAEELIQAASSDIDEEMESMWLYWGGALSEITGEIRNQEQQQEQQPTVWASEPEEDEEEGPELFNYNSGPSTEVTSPEPSGTRL